MRRDPRIERRSLPARPMPAVPAEEPMQHGRAVKAFVRDYSALQDMCIGAFSRNHQDDALDLIERMRQMERRIVFLPAEGAAS
jgi:hypothetical protein